jgi:hypothetical protein
MEKKIGNLPEITEEEIEKAKEDTGKFLTLLFDRYVKINLIKPESNNPFALCIFRIFEVEMCNGGFRQLFEDGFGTYIFENNFLKTIKSWGAIKTSEIIEKAKKIYEELKKEYEELGEDLKYYKELDEKSKECAIVVNDDALSCFENLEVAFFENFVEEEEIIEKYIEENINDFVKIIK